MTEASAEAQLVLAITRVNHDELYGHQRPERIVVSVISDESDDGAGVLLPPIKAAASKNVRMLSLAMALIDSFEERTPFHFTLCDISQGAVKNHSKALIVSPLFAELHGLHEHCELLLEPLHVPSIGLDSVVLLPLLPLGTKLINTPI